MKKYILYLTGIFIFIPDFMILSNISGIFKNDTYVYLITFILVIYILYKSSSYYRQYVSLLFLLILLFMVIKSALYLNKYVIKYFYFVPSFPFNIKMLITLTISLGIISLFEGVTSNSFKSLISYYIVSTGIFLYQIAYITAESLYNITYFNAVALISFQEYLSLFSLFTNGYETFLPLHTIKLAIGSYLLIGFIISLISMIMRLYLSSYSNKDSITGSYALLIGIVAGYLSFILIKFTTTYKLQFLSLAIVIISIFIIIAHSNKVSKKHSDNENL